MPARKKDLAKADDDTFIAMQVARYEKRNAVLEQIVAEGPRVMSTAVGKLMIDPDSGKVARDASQVIAAVKELRLNESYVQGLRRETGDDTEALAEISGYISGLERENARLDADNQSLRRTLGYYQADAGDGNGHVNVIT